MVIQEEDEAPVEATISKRSKYVVVKNHVRELPENPNSGKEISDVEVEEKANKTRNKQLKRKKIFQEGMPSDTEIAQVNKEDLDELRTIYNKCKSVLLKIESKYGHLLDLDDEEGTKAKRSKYTSEESEYEECSCSKNKKIIFDENGQQIEQECQLENHICPKTKKNRYFDTLPQNPTIEIEYDNISVNLPDSLQELQDILKDPKLDNMYRKMVIDKVFLTRQEYLSDMRYEKETLIKQLKENPDELLDFKGTNMSSLPGYPIQPLNNSE